MRQHINRDHEVGIRGRSFRGRQGYVSGLCFGVRFL